MWCGVAGGVRDIFHGVRLGIDTFDCVHPTRLARHGGALVPAAHWEQRLREVEARNRQEEQDQEHSNSQEAKEKVVEAQAAAKGDRQKLTHKERKQQNWQRTVEKQKRMQRQSELVVREHVNIAKPFMAGDPRPIDPQCRCHTCQHFSRGYLHHLFKSKEILGQVLLTTHNVHFMNKLMSDIREGIDTDSLDAVERVYIHPEMA